MSYLDAPRTPPHFISEIEPGGRSVHRIGDCVAPREVDSVVYEGKKIAPAL